MPTSMTQLFDQIHEVPRVPEVVRTLINQVNDPHAEILDIVKNVEKEQILSMKILRLVNSAYFGLSKKVASIAQATVMIGMNQLKTLVIASGIVDSVPRIENFDIKRFWANSFRTAEYAKWLANKTQQSPDVAYTAGLICNLGQILLQIAFPSEANEIEQHIKAGHMSRSEIENKRLGFTSQAVCAELCRRWKFADELIDIIDYCDNPLRAENAPLLAIVVHLARLISDDVDRGLDKDAILSRLPMEAVERLGASDFLTNHLDELLQLQTNLEGMID